MESPCIVVTGGGGRLGQELKRQRPDDVVALTRRDLDILAPHGALRRDLQRLEPDVVVHAAGITDLGYIEMKHAPAWRCHVDGTANVARACAYLDVPLLYTSTDYVFSGYKTGAMPNYYTEESFADPLSFYGTTKLVSEELVRAVCPRSHLILRGTMKDKTWKHSRAPTDMWQSMLLREDYARVLLWFTDRLANGGILGTYHIGGPRFNVFDWAKHWRSDVEPCLRSDLDAFRLPGDISLDCTRARGVGAPLPEYPVRLGFPAASP